MKKRDFLFAAAALTVLTACSSDDATTEPIEQLTPVTLKYTTVDATETRAAQNLNEGTFAEGETVKVCISNTGAGSWTDYNFTTAAAGAMTAPAIPPYYPAGAQNIDIVAYYPATAGASFSVQADQTSDADYKASDLMFASVTNQAKQAAPVELAFSHKMAKLNVNITAGTGVTGITSVSILNVKPTVSFDQSTGVVGEASGDATTIAMSNNGATLIPAQTINGGLLSIVTDKGTATYTVSNKAFESGKVYTINLTVNLRAVGATNAITGWNSEGTVTVNPAAEALTVLNVTSEHVGWVITGDGYVYQNKAAVEAAGKTGVALIFYVGDAGTADAGSASYRGLAISLTRVSSYKKWGYDASGACCLGTQYDDYSTAATDMNGLLNTMTLVSHYHTKGTTDCSHFAASFAVNHTPLAPKGTSGWFLGSMGQWVKYLTSCGITPSDVGIAENGVPSMNALFKTAGYGDLFSVSGNSENQYWTSTERTNTEGNPAAWMVNLYYDYPNLFVCEQLKDLSALIRPFTAF